MRIPEKISKLYERIVELENRVDELEKKVNSGKMDQIGFAIDTSESMNSEESWDNTGEVWPIHWVEDDKNG